MRPLWNVLDYLRWKLFDYLQKRWPVEKPSEQELIAYGAEQERQKPNPLKDPKYVEMIRTERFDKINAETARELQRYIDDRKSAHYEPPEKHTDAVSSSEIDRAIRFHAHHLRRIETHTRCKPYFQ